MVDSVSNEFVYFPFENLNGTYRTFPGERETGVSWSKNDTLMYDGKTKKWKKLPTSHGTGSPWFVSSDIGSGVTSFTVNEAPYIRLMPPKYKQRSLPGMIADTSDLIGDFAETNNSLKYSMQSSKVIAELFADMVVVPGTRGYISLDKNGKSFFTQDFTYPIGNLFRAQGIATSNASKKGDVVDCIMYTQIVDYGIASVLEGDNSSRDRNPMTVAEVTGGFTMAIPVGGDTYERYTSASDKLFQHPFVYNYNGNRLSLPSSSLFQNDSEFLCSPVFICKSRKEAMVCAVTHKMIGLVSDEDGNPTGVRAYLNDTLTIPSLSWFTTAPNTVTRDYLNTLLIAKDVPAGAIPSKYNSDQDIKSIVWSFSHRGRAIPCTNAPLGAEEELPETHKLNFFRGATVRIGTAPAQYRATDVDGELDKGYVYNNNMLYSGSSEDYYDPYNDEGIYEYWGQVRNGSIKGMGYLFAGNKEFGLTSVNSATVGTRHGSSSFHGTVIARSGMVNGGSWQNDTNWFTQFFSTGDRLLPDMKKSSFCGPIDYNGSPISIMWSGDVKEGSLNPSSGNIFGWFPLYGDVWQNFCPAQEFIFDVRKIKCRLSNPPLETPKPESEMTFESDHLFHTREESDPLPAVTKVGNNLTVNAVRVANSAYIHGFMDNYATYDTSTSRYGTLDFRPPGAYCRGLFWLEKEVEGKIVKYYIQANNIVSKYPIWRHGTIWSSEIMFAGIGSRTARNWSYGFTELPGTLVADPGDIHYKIQQMLEIVDWSVGCYKTSDLFNNGPAAGYVPNVMWEWEGTI